jgi:hypothetical protein
MSQRISAPGRKPSKGILPVAVLSLLLPLMFIPEGVIAQSGSSAQQSQQMSRQQMQAQIMEEFERRMARELRLSREEFREVQAVLRAMREERSELFQRQRAHHARLQSFGASGGTDAEAREILREARSLRARTARIEAEEEARLLELMSPSQLLRFQFMRAEFNEQIRRMQRPGRPPSPE